jgi:hypothetical protein
MKSAGLIIGCLVLGAAAPPPTVAPPPPAAAAPATPTAPADTSVTPLDGWNIVPVHTNSGCAAKTPPTDGVSFGVTMARTRAVSFLFGGEGWKVSKDVYDIAIRVDDLPPVTVSMFGSGQALIAQVPPELRASLMTAGKIGFHFMQQDFTIPVHDVAGAVARLEDCVTKQTGKPPEKPAE